MKPNSLSSKEAIVIGDGLTGLLAAQALSDYFRQVYVIGQPYATEDAPPVLLHGPDQAALEALFPGLLAELAAAGAVRFNLGLHMAWFVYGRWRPRYRSALESVACSPALLTERIRHRLADYPAVHFLPQEEIVGLAGEVPLRQVTGVHLRESGLLAADLVVDASGQFERSRAWLGQLVERPLLTPSLVKVGRIYQQPEHPQESWQALIIQPTAEQPRRGAVILPMEGKRLHVTLLGAAQDAPPLTEPGFLAFARSLPTPRVAEIMTQAVPLSAIRRLGKSSCTLCATPLAAVERFILLPEPDQSPNPAMQQAAHYYLQNQAALSETLAEGLDGLNDRWQRQVAERLRPACMLARTEAQRWVGFVEMGSAAMSHYMDRVIAASLDSAQVLEALYSVQQMLEPPTLLFRPDIVLQVVARQNQTGNGL